MSCQPPDHTCEITCRMLCARAIRKAITEHIPYESAMELIIKSESASERTPT